MAERIKIRATVHRVKGARKTRASLLESLVLDAIPRERQEAAGIKFYPDMVFLTDLDRVQRFNDGRPIVRAGGPPDGSARIYKWRTRRYPPAIAAARQGQLVTLTATVEPWDNGAGSLGGYLTRCTDVVVTDG